MKDIAQGQRRLDGKIAVVTGAGAGIGQGCALMFAAQGATVYALDIDEEAAKTTAAQATGTVHARCADLLDEAATMLLIDEIGATEGRIDILVPAAAVSLFRWIEDMTLADWQRPLAGELDIVFQVTRAAWPWLKHGGKASIVNVASANAHMALHGSPALAIVRGRAGCSR